MKPLSLLALLCLCPLAQPLFSAEKAALSRALTLHVPFENDLHAAFTKGDKSAYLKSGSKLLAAEPNDEAKLTAGGGKYGNALWFPKKGATRPQYKGEGTLGYNATDWSCTVSAWLKLTPDEDLEPGYCDPIQIVGNDSKKGFIFLEWSKDETPRLFRYAIRPLFHIWNPDNVQWADIPFEKRPMVQVAKAPFSRESWTHVAFTVENINKAQGKPAGSLYLDGALQGRIENWNLIMDWDPAQVWLVLGAAYVGHMDDLAAFDRVLSAEEIKLLMSLPQGVRELYP